ncbi:MAG TPA: hypothetical protein VNE39_25360 [Planctomycetota bacterium]|nr:hypothetical protein [Planctomycetota bacterium]
MAQMRRLVLVAVASLLVPAGAALAAAAKAGKPAAVQCARCRDTKRVPCPVHDRASPKYRAFCSACAEPACCKGVGWTPCPRCADDETRKRFDEIAALYAKEREGGGFYAYGAGLTCSASEHYRFKAAATHKECHEFQAAAEKAFSLFRKVFGESGVDELKWDGKGHMLLLASREDYHKFLDWFYEQHPTANPNERDFLRDASGVRMVTDRLQVLVKGQTYGQREDKGSLLHRIAHGAGHLAIENYKVHGNTPDWLDEGWAARSEIEALREPQIYCVQYESPGVAERKPSEWRQIVRDAIRRKAAPPLEKLFEMKVGDMHGVEWAVALSVVSWLLEQSPSKFARIVDAVKDGKGSKEAVEAVLEQDLGKAERAWQRWALFH